MASEPSSGDDDEKAAPATDAGLDERLDRAVAGGEAVAFLIAVAGDQPGRVFPLARNTTFVGRVDDADIHVGDPSVSGRHARIINGSQGIEIEDLGSTNGTFVAGQRITRTRLRNGDRVTLGSVDFNFVIDSPVEATVALLPPGTWRSTSTAGALMRLPDPRHFAPPPPPVRRELEEEAPSLGEVVQRLVLAYRFLRRYAVLIAILVGIGAGIGLISLVVLPPAQAAFCEVKLHPQLKGSPVEGDRPDDALELFGGPQRAFTNPELVKVTLKQLDGVEPDDNRLSSIAGRLKFENLDEPHLYRVSYKDGLFSGGQPPPVKFLGSHIQNYVQSEINKALKVFSAEADFLRSQMKTVEKEMATIAAERTDFRQKNADRLPEEAIQTHSSRFQLETRRAELLTLIRRLQSELDSERRQLKSESPLAQNRYQSSQVYRQSLAVTNQKLTEAYARGLADGHPDVRQLKDEKQRIEALIENEMKSDTSAVDRQSIGTFQALGNRVEALQGQLSAAKADLADTQGSLGRARSVASDLPRVEERVQELSHRQDATNRLHAQLFEKLKKAELQLNLERVSAESRYEMVKPPRPEKFGKVKTAVIRCGIGLFLGLFVAAVAIAIREGRQLVAETMQNLENRRRPSWR